MIGLQPKTVTIQQEGEWIEIPIDRVEVGNMVLVKPGEKIAVDGEVVAGESYVDESMISGEPLPVAKKTGEKVYAGTINQKGSFQFKAVKVGKETLLAHIIQMVQQAQGSKAPVQKLVDKIAGIFVPAVISIAVLTFFIWLIFGEQNGFTYGLLSMITVLVIACPCALGLATPTAIMVGIGRGAEHGILIKDAESLETMRKINALVLDKTGTITEGRPTVNEMKWFVEENEMLRNVLFSIEKSSEHPLAEAIVNHLKEKSSFIQDILVENVSGQGIQGNYKNIEYWIGNPDFLREKNVHINDNVLQWIDQKQKQAATVVLFGAAGRLFAGIVISDQIKESSAQAVQELNSKGIEVYMLTGDNEQTAKAVAEKVGILHYRAGVLPQDKVDFIKELQKEGKIVGMVGDGINDSGALAQAEVGIAMGKGSDIAVETARMTIISNDLMKIPEAIRLSELTVSTIRQNLFWAFIYNVIGIPLAAGILYPINGFMMDPMIAGAAMALSSVSVVSNSLRLKWRK